MDPTVDGWRDELKKYFRSIENISESALKRIKRDRTRNNLPFDDSFKDFILKRASVRIAYVYTNLMDEGILEDEQMLTDQIDHTQNNVYGLGNIGQQLVSIDQMPIILVPSNNQNVASNTTASTTFAHDGNQFVSEQMIISIPSAVPSELEINQNPEDESRAQNNRTEHSRIDDVKEKSTMEIPREVVASKPMIRSNPNKNTEKPKALPKRLNIKPSSNGTDRYTHDEKHSELIDLTSDQEDVTDSSDNGQIFENQSTSKNTDKSVTSDDSVERTSINGAVAVTSHANKQMQPGGLSVTNVESNSQKSSNYRNGGGVGKDYGQEVNGEPVGRQKVSNNQHSKMTNSMSDHRESVRDDAKNVPKGIENIAGPSQPAVQRRNRENDGTLVKENSKKNEKLVRRVDTNKRRHECDYCEYSTDYTTNLIRHIRIHTGECPFECEVCEKRFNRKGNLNSHMKTHRDMFVFQCSNCRQGFTDEKQWKLHENNCKAKGYECHLCRKIFLQKPHLVDHMRKHTGKMLCCTKCRKQFNSKPNLTAHMKTHGKLFRFQCSTCRLGFSQRTLWKLHESRCKAKQYECYLCRKKFHQKKGNLLVHMRHKHTGEKPFGCYHCSKRFCGKSELTRHTKNFH